MLVQPFQDVQAVYFDLDDTLCAYWDACKAGLRATFEACPIAGHSTEDVLLEWAAAFREFCPSLKGTPWYDVYLKEAGPTRTELMRRTLERLGVDSPGLPARLSHTYLMLRDAQLCLFPDALATLDALEGRYPLGLITNGPADLQRMEIETLGIAPRFKTILIEGELGFGKPEPEVFALAASAMGLEPGQLLFVGNSYVHDIRPAMDAAWRTAWVRRPSDVPPSVRGVEFKPEELPPGAPAPDAIVLDLRDLLA